MAVDTARDSGGGRTHTSGCDCGGCPHGAREGHRRAVEAFIRQREAFATGAGVPEAVAYSPEASRQWVSDELTHSALEVAERGREVSAAWLSRQARRSAAAIWSAVALLLLGQLITALGAGWSTARTAGLLAAAALAGLLTLTAWLHRARGGVLAPLIGADNRLSTSRTVAAAWLLFTCYATLVAALTLAGTSGGAERAELLSGLSLAAGGGLLTVLAVSLVAAGWVRHTVARRVRGFAMQKVRATRPRAADVLTDDAGRAGFLDLQYVLIHGAVLVLAAVQLGREPAGLPQVPWAPAALAAVSALAYLAGKYTEGGRPVIQSVVRVREPGDLPGPIRPGDDIEIRGSGFVPAGAEAADRLAETVVVIGAVHVPAPLVPVPGGFSNPRDHLLTVPVPAEIDSGRVEVRVITAAGTESGRYPITVAD
ncbi:hypothetical protein PJ985_07395 [Streptomyces sp. ACA25]|uniref:hypothetical protein n=1 Tax=Streptomyces sp. ACA25 TaxID=3022596 RepID=UPI0023075533|nr:hypothetical protein [Streptomyces sp. ACA25]MDB1087387.1 hypothetical protein [Streptomyces sp. ACA25]